MKTFEDVANDVGLDAITRKRFCTYMRSRWGKDEARMSIDGYGREWAERFLQGVEYQASDNIGRSILVKIEGK